MVNRASEISIMASPPDTSNHSQCPIKVPVYILAGGCSTRMGSDKARLKVGKTTLLERVANAAEPIASSITVVGRHGQHFGDVTFGILRDIRPDAGPLGGLESALVHVREDWLLLLACDTIGIQTGILKRLIEASCGDADVVMYETPQLQPLIALYSKRLLPAVQRRLDKGERSMQGLVGTVRCRMLCPPPEWETVENLNTAKDVERYLARMEVEN